MYSAVVFTTSSVSSYSFQYALQIQLSTKYKFIYPSNYIIISQRWIMGKLKNRIWRFLLQTNIMKYHKRQCWEIELVDLFVKSFKSSIMTFSSLNEKSHLNSKKRQNLNPRHWCCLILLNLHRHPVWCTLFYLSFIQKVIKARLIIKPICYMHNFCCYMIMCRSIILIGSFSFVFYVFIGISIGNNQWIKPQGAPVIESLILIMPSSLFRICSK